VGGAKTGDPRDGWRLRGWSASDHAAVDRILTEIWGDDPAALASFRVHGPASDESGAWSRTLVAESGGDVVGVGTAREYWLHPARWRLAVHVRPGARRRGIGGALFDRLVAGLPMADPRPLQAATRENDADGVRFLGRRGFRLLMRTRLGALDPNDVVAADRAAWLAAEDRIAAAGYRVAAMPDLGAGIEAALAALHAAIYRAGHGGNPPVPIDDDLARDLFLGDDLIPDALFAAVAGGLPAGIASLRRGDDAGGFDLGWIGAGPGHAEHAGDLCAALLGRCLDAARRRGWRLRVEVDEADAGVWRQLGGLPVAWEPDWVTWHREPGAVP